MDTRVHPQYIHQLAKLLAGENLTLSKIAQAYNLPCLDFSEEEFPVSLVAEYWASAEQALSKPCLGLFAGAWFEVGSSQVFNLGLIAYAWMNCDNVTDMAVVAMNYRILKGSAQQIVPLHDAQKRSLQIDVSFNGLLDPESSRHLIEMDFARGMTIARFLFGEVGYQKL